MIEDIRAKRQMANLCGRAVGQLNQKIVDVKLILNEESNPPRFSIEVLDTSNTTNGGVFNLRMLLELFEHVQGYRFYRRATITSIRPFSIHYGVRSKCIQVYTYNAFHGVDQ